MSRTINARVAGVTFLVYIVAGITQMAVAKHHPRLNDGLTLLTSICALALGVTLYAITRDVDRDLALFALLCRVMEAMHHDGEIFFAIGSTIFAWLLLRGRIVPAWIAWIGVISSALLAIILPLQHARLIGERGSWSSALTWMIWMPCLVYELSLAFWLLAKGARAPAATPAT